MTDIADFAKTYHPLFGRSPDLHKLSTPPRISTDFTGRQSYVGYPEPPLIGLRVMNLGVEECESGIRSEPGPEKIAKSG